MNKALVPIFARLTSLQSAAQIAPGGSRVIADLSNPSPVTMLLREVNETILGRSLRFESSGGSTLTLEVAGRRILRLTDVAGLSGAEACLAAGTLEDEHKDDLIKIMQALAPPRSELRVMSFATGQVGGEVSVGLPVALLADLLLVDLNEAPAGQNPEPVPEVRAPAPQHDAKASAETQAIPTVTRSLTDLARGIGPTLVAWLVRGGADDGTSEGPDEMVSHLQGFVEDEAEAVFRQMDLVSNQPGGAICAVLGASLREGHSLLCARSGEGLLIGVVEGDATPILLSAWAGAKA